MYCNVKPGVQYRTSLHTCCNRNGEHSKQACWSRWRHDVHHKETIEPLRILEAFREQDIQTKTVNICFSSTLVWEKHFQRSHHVFDSRSIWLSADVGNFVWTLAKQTNMSVFYVSYLPKAKGGRPMECLNPHNHLKTGGGKGKLNLRICFTTRSKLHFRT